MTKSIVSLLLAVAIGGLCFVFVFRDDRPALELPAPADRPTATENPTPPRPERSESAATPPTPRAHADAPTPTVESSPTAADAITGVVRDSTGTTVAGALVRATTARHGQIEATVRARATTDETGRFALRSLTAPCRVQAVSGRALSASRPAKPGEHIDLELRDGGSLSGTVRYARDGRAAADVTLALYRLARRDRFDLRKPDLGQWLWPKRCQAAVRSDDEGRYRFGALAAGRYLLRVLAPGCPQQNLTDDPIEIRVGEGRTRDLLVGSGIALHGTVIDAATKTPLAGATVRLAEDERKEAVTNEHGDYEIRGIPIGPVVTVVASAPGYNPNTVGAYRDTFGDLEVATVGLLRAARVTGTVFGPDGKPVPGARVGLIALGVTDRRADIRAVRYPVATSDADGNYALDSPATGGVVRLWAAADDVGWGRSDVIPNGLYPGGSYAGVNCYLGHGGSVRGQVIEQGGGAVVGASVHLLGAKGRLLDEAITDGEGRYAFRGIAAGTYDVEAIPKGLLATSASALAWVTRKGVEIGAGQQTVDLTVPVGGAIHGRILDADGRPVGSATVRARPHAPPGPVQQHTRYSPRAARITRSNPDGSFAITGLTIDPPHAYSLEVLCDGFAPYFKREVFAGTHDATLTLEPLITITGFVRAAEGPVSEFIVSARRSEERGPDYWPGAKKQTSFERIVVDAEGAWHLRVTPGEYRVEATTRDGRTTNAVNVIARRGVHAAVDLFVLAASRVVCELQTADGSPAPWAMVYLYAIGDRRPVKVRYLSVDASSFEVEGLSPGRYMVTAECNGQFGVGQVELRANTSVDLAVRMTKPVRVDARVVSDDDTPIVAARVRIEREDGLPAAMIASEREVLKMSGRIYRMQRGLPTDFASARIDYIKNRRHLSRTTAYGTLLNLWLLPGRYRYHVTADGYEATTSSVRVDGGRRELTVRLAAR